MTEPAENNALPPFKLAVAAATAVLCGAIVYNAVAGQDGRQRDVLSRIGDLEQHRTLPVTIGVGAFDGRPTTKSTVTIEQLAELAAKESEGEIRAAAPPREGPMTLADIDVRAVQQGLARLGYAPGPDDGMLGAQTRDAIRQFEQDRNLARTGDITEELAREVSRVLAAGG
jgi:hypothetical protein